MLRERVFKKRLFLAFVGILTFSASNMSCSDSFHKRMLGNHRYNQLRASEALKKIRDAEVIYKSEKGGYGSIHELINSKLVASEIAGEEYDGYRISMSNKRDSYKVTAVPVKYRVTGSLAFYLDESGIIRVSSRGEGEATSSDPAIVEQ